MKSIFMVALLTVVVAVANAGDLQDFEELDVDKFFGDDDKVKAVFSCLMDQTPCGEMQFLRDKLPTLVQTNCADCTPTLKKKYDEVKNTLNDKYPEQFKALALKYSSKSD